MLVLAFFTVLFLYVALNAIVIVVKLAFERPLVPLNAPIECIYFFFSNVFFPSYESIQYDSDTEWGAVFDKFARVPVDEAADSALVF